MTPRTMKRIRIAILIGLLIWVAVQMSRTLNTTSTPAPQQAPTPSVIPGPQAGILRGRPALVRVADKRSEGVLDPETIDAM